MNGAGVAQLRGGGDRVTESVGCCAEAVAIMPGFLIRIARAARW